MITLLISILGMLAGVIINLTDRRTILSGLFPLLSLLVLTTLLPVSWLALIIFLIVIPLGLIGEVLTYDGYWLTKHVGIGVKSLFFFGGRFFGDGLRPHGSLFMVTNAYAAANNSQSNANGIRLCRNPD